MDKVEGGSLMDGINNNWLPHLSPPVTSKIEGNFLDAYAVALEGWRRGLTLRWHVKDSEKFKDMKTWYVDQPGQLFSLQSKERIHYFFRTRGDLVTNEAVKLSMDKQQTKEILKQSNLPQPEGKLFNKQHSFEDIKQYSYNIGYPVVVKPLNGSFGRGVFTEIQEETGLKKAIKYIQTVLKESSIIVEKHVYGKDYRLYVVDDKVVGAILRVPPNIIGDGVNTIETLIKQKNKLRGENPRLVSCPILIDSETKDYLKKHRYELNTIPKMNEIIYTNPKANISLGGDPIDVLETLSGEMKELAVQALCTIPNLPHGAVDLMIETKEDGREIGNIIELNPTAQLGGILFPIEGKSRDVPKEIINYYFPETKEVEKTNQLYFDFDDVLTPLAKGVTKTVKIVNCHSDSLIAKKIDINEKDIELFDSKIRNQAIRLKLNGSIKVIAKNNIEIIIIGTNKQIKEFYYFLKEKIISSYAKIDEYDWDYPIKLGFQIDNKRNKIINEIETIQQITDNYNKEIKMLETKYKHMVNSNSWKLTAPVRMISKIFKKRK